MMEIKVKGGSVLEFASDLAVLAVGEDVILPDSVAGLIEPKDFSGKIKKTLLLYPGDAVKPRRLLLIGMGKPDKVRAETLREVAAVAIKEARNLQADTFSFGFLDQPGLDAEKAGQALAEGFEMGSYRYLPYKTELKDEEKFSVGDVTVYSKDEQKTGAGLVTGQIIGRGVVYARDLVNGPGGLVTPAYLGEKAETLGKELGLKVTVLGTDELVKQGFGGIMAVGGASVNEPRFIVMEYGKAQEGVPTICLVGKGLTFDSGGLNIKPAEAMEMMKSDMGGSATVFGAMQAIAELKLPLHAVGIVCAAENMPGSKAYRPGDVVKGLSGKTIEILNTDAEGRVILSDGLHYAQSYKPDAIIEFSTLTGAMIIALGAHASGIMATDQALADQLIAAGEESGERVWQLPLWDEYKEMIKSDIADIKNLGGRAAGSITAGAFLAAFVGDYPFAHVDIAGTGWLDKPNKAYQEKGGQGVGVRLVVEMLNNYTN
jgi:leucyl aminopeptidase